MQHLVVKKMAGLCRAVLLAVMMTAGGAWEVRSQSIAPDGTLGAETSVLIEGSVVGGGAARGRNLFHSFSEFNIDSGESVYFTNPNGIDNILSRITGTSLSTINGRLGVLGNANLFLLNPNGIVFGADAQLDISGSFTASTADRIVFADNSTFAVENQNIALLSVSVPVGIQLNATSSQRIVNSGNLQSRQDLALSGNTLVSEGTLTAAGSISLQALADISATGTITAGNSTDISTLSGNITTGDLVSSVQDISAETVPSAGDIRLTTGKGDITTGNIDASFTLSRDMISDDVDVGVVQ